MPPLGTRKCRLRIAAADHGVLATTGETRPHLVPIVYAVDGNTLVSVVDHKPKSTPNLARLANLRRDPRCSVLVEHYEDDWDRLWWVRVDGVGGISDQPALVEVAGLLLAARYPPYRERPPSGPVIRIDIVRMVGWSATPR